MIGIGYFADGPWSHEAFKIIYDDKAFEFRFIVPRVGTNDDTLKNFASKYNIDYLPNMKVNSPDFLKKIKDYKCDIFASMSFNQIFKNGLLRLPRLGTINCHAGKLPFYRGRNVLNWALINDEKEFGITVHYMDEGIDTGDIILQRTFPIRENDDYSSLLKVAYKECAHILYDSLKLIQHGKVNRIIQSNIHPFGSYYSKRKEGDENINWNWDSRRIFNFVRALKQPDGPGAKAFLETGEEIIINWVEQVSEAPPYIDINGSILFKEDDILFVKVADTIIKVIEYISPIKIRVGTRFKSRSF